MGFCRKMDLVSHCGITRTLHSSDIGHNMFSFKGWHFQQEMMLQSIRWYVANPLSYRDT